MPLIAKFLFVPSLWDFLVASSACGCSICVTTITYMWVGLLQYFPPAAVSWAPSGRAELSISIPALAVRAHEPL